MLYKIKDIFKVICYEEKRYLSEDFYLLVYNVI